MHLQSSTPLHPVISIEEVSPLVNTTEDLTRVADRASPSPIFRIIPDTGFLSDLPFESGQVNEYLSLVVC
jgi:hypothetical protein